MRGAACGIGIVRRIGSFGQSGVHSDEFERVGGSRPIKVDVRLVCATNEDLPGMAERGEFRADLLDRLAFDVITLPPMRERREDIMQLAEHFAINMPNEPCLSY